MRQFPIVTSEAIREQFIQTYPAITGNDVYWRILQYVYYCPWWCDYTGHPVMSREVVSDLTGVSVNYHAPRAREGGLRHFNVDQLLAPFETDVLPLNLSENFSYVTGRARTADPELDAALVGAIAAYHRTEDPKPVFFLDGRRANQGNLTEVRGNYHTSLAAVAASVDPGHPAFELLQFLKHQSPLPLKHCLEASRPYLETVLSAMPTVTPQGLKTQHYARSVHDNLADGASHVYRPVERTVRIYAAGSSPNYYPRELRKIALGGNVEIDLASAQVGIMAKLWGAKEMYRFLRDRSSLWAELLRYLELPPSFKPLIKRVTFCVGYGMGNQNLHALAEFGDAQYPGMGAAAAKRYFQHSLILELLQARRAEMRRIQQHGAAVDAFGRRVNVPYEKRRPRNHAVLAIVAQSHELRLMLELLPILKAERSIQLLNWLHDGVTVHFTDRSKQERQIRRMKRALDEAAAALDIPTWANDEALPYPDEAAANLIAAYQLPQPEALQRAA